MPKNGKNDKCTACGGYEFSLTDGFMYCNRCGALLENFEELEQEEVGGVQLIVGAGKIKIKKPEGDGKREKRKAPEPPTKSQLLGEQVARRAEFLKKQQVRKENLPYNQTPDYLYGIGRRLFAFTELLSKSSYILVKELHFHPKLQKMTLAVFQRYLAHCQVAFCHQEQCGSDEQLRFVAIMENIHFQEEELAEKRRKKQERKGKGIKALSKSAAAWTLLTQGNLTENLDMVSSDEDSEAEEAPEDVPEDVEDSEDMTREVNDTTMGFVRRVTTALSKESLRRAGQMVLGLEILAVILHSSLLSTGYSSILLSDVIRWIREDRFRIPHRSIRMLCRSLTEPGEITSHVESREHFLKFPLFEITRTCTLFNQSVNIEDFQVLVNFEKVAARIIDNLNLPIDVLTGVLMLESIIPCDMSYMLRKQVDVKNGRNFEELTGTMPKLLLNDYLSCFGRKESQRISDEDEVLLSVDTRVMSYILFALKLTFDLDGKSNDLEDWIYQLEMRLKCWQGHDMKMVLRSTCPIPQILLDTPFGPNYDVFETKNQPILQYNRRNIGFRKCIPSEMSFNSTANLPTVFDTRNNRYSVERRRLDALLTPLKFQTILLRKEIDGDGEKFKHVDGTDTFFKDFSNLKTHETADSFNEFFPCSSSYLRAGPLRFFLSNQSCSDLLSVASAGFSPRFSFLLSSLALTIGEDEKALYSAFLMLEIQFSGAEKLKEMRKSLVESTPIQVDGQFFSCSSFHIPTKFGVLADSPISKIEDLRFFGITNKYFEHSEMDSEAELLKFARNLEIRQNLDPTKDEQHSYLWKTSYDFDTFFGILALKFW